MVCDIDGVLAFFAEAIVTALNAHFGLSLLVDEMRHYWLEEQLPPEQGEWLCALFGREVLYANLAPDYSAMNALSTLHAANFHVIVSSDRAATLSRVTEQWLRKWDVACDDIVLNGPGSKADLLRDFGLERPAVLIDDNPSMALSVAKPGVEVWSPRRPWTLTNWRDYAHYRVFDSWAMVLDRLGVPALVAEA